MKIIYLEGREPFGMYLKVLTWRNILIFSYLFTLPGKISLLLILTRIGHGLVRIDSLEV